MKAVAATLLVIGGVPILAYPAIALAGIMSLAGHRDGTESFSLLLVSRAALLSSLLYPAAYFPCLMRALTKFRTKESAVRISAMPLGCLAVIVLLFLLWFAVE